jgi:YegS/Rv2252/BmrU family lipid kinase
MRKAVLLYNARSGQCNNREAALRDALQILTNAGVSANLVCTQSSSDAAEQARQAIREGHDAVFACGGDGTIHDVLQAMAGTRVALGVIPMGTANALAHDLGIPLDVRGALCSAIHADARRIALGQVTARGLDGNPTTRYFTVAVGVGVDAHLFYGLNPAIKQRLGIGAYYAKAWHLWFSHRMERFRVRFPEDPQQSRNDVTELLAVRIRNFGGILQELAPGASLDRNDLRLVVCRTSSRILYLLYVFRGLLRAKWQVPGVELNYSTSVHCDYSSDYDPVATTDSKVYVEADGELIGTLPAEIKIIPDALTLLAPRITS